MPLGRLVTPPEQEKRGFWKTNGQIWWVEMKKMAKGTTSAIFGPGGECRLPVHVGKRGAPKGNRNAERDGLHNREAKARHARYSAVLKDARLAMKEAKVLLQEIRIESRLKT
jgi:hypothetical protein